MKYPEEEIVYRGLRGRLRHEFICSHIRHWKGRLLDIGCNAGPYFGQYTDGGRMGVDISWHALMKAKEKYCGIDLAVGDAENLDFLKSSSFHHILCTELMEHVFHPDRVMNAIARLLKPGGTALITAPDYKNKRPEWTELKPLKAYGIRLSSADRYFHSAFHPEELAQMGMKAGLQVKQKGTLEHAVKYASKCPSLLFIIIRFCNRFFHSPTLDRFNQRMFDASSLAVYRCACALGINGILVKMIPRGTRSFVILERGQ